MWRLHLLLNSLMAHGTNGACQLTAFLFSLAPSTTMSHLNILQDGEDQVVSQRGISVQCSLQYFDAFMAPNCLTHPFFSQY